MLGVGILRLVLALTVVITHTHSIYGFTLGNPVIAVRTFFVISGFYMTLVLREKYTEKQAFWINRGLKIYPIYWVVLALTILSCIGAYVLRGNWGELLDLVVGWSSLSWAERILIFVSHLSIFGRSLVMFDNFAGKSGVLFLLVPQAWTLVLELWFYLLAPWIVTKKWPVIATTAIMSLLARAVVYQLGGKGDLWEYRFFPSEAVYFLLGAGSYYVYRHLMDRKKRISNILGIGALVLSIAALSTFNYWPGNIYIREWGFYLLLAVLIPIVFTYSQKSKLDRQIGDLSYPVYISHILVNNIVNPLLLIPLSINRNFQAPIVMTGSVVMSILLNYFIQSPIEKFRQEKIK